MVLPRLPLAGFLLLSCIHVAAQTQDDQPRGRFPVGSAMTITPSIVVVSGYDTNFIRTESGEGKAEFWFSPQVEGWLGRGRTRVNFVGALEVASPGQQEENVNNYVRAEGQFGSAALQLRAGAGRRDHYAPPTDFAGFAFGIKSRRVETELSAGASATAGRMRASATVEHFALRYDADAVYEGSSLHDNLNRNMLRAGTGLEFKVTPLTALTASFNLFDDRFLYAPERDGNGYEVFAGVGFDSAALLAGYARAGILHYKNKLLQTEFTSPSYLLGLQFSRGALFIDVQGSSDVDYSPDRVGYYLSNGLDTYAMYQSQRKIDLFLRWSVRGIYPRGLVAAFEEERGVQLMKAGFAVRATRWVRVGAEVERYSYTGAGAFKGTRAIGFLIYGTDRLQRLDRTLPGDF